MRNSGEELDSIKYERFSEFCCVCGLLDHVTGICKFHEPVMVTTAQGITARLFGLWLRAEHTGGLVFTNPVDDEDGRHVLAVKGKTLIHQ